MGVNVMFGQYMSISGVLALDLGILSAFMCYFQGNM